MSLLVQMSVNGNHIDAVEIINRGPLDKDHVEFTAHTRWYEWKASSGGTGFVLHRREEGAHVLAVKVLDAIARAKPYPQDRTGDDG
jgi:hypothetical protein